MTTIIGIDPGGKTGYAVYNNGEWTSGVWKLKDSRLDGYGARFLKLRRLIKNMIVAYKPTLLVFEGVTGHKGMYAAQVYGGYVAEITSLCEQYGLVYKSIHTGVLKKHATGKGNAKKSQMIEAAKERWGLDMDDNEADARWLVQAGLDGL